MTSYARRLRDRARQGRTIYLDGISVDWEPVPDELVCWRTTPQGRAAQAALTQAVQEAAAHAHENDPTSCRP